MDRREGRREANEEKQKDGRERRQTEEEDGDGDGEDEVVMKKRDGEILSDAEVEPAPRADLRAARHAARAFWPRK